MIKMQKVMFVSSTGGHLNELLKLKDLFKKYDYSIVTEGIKNNKHLKKEYKNVSFLLYGTKDHMATYPFILLCNAFICLFIYLRRRPNYIVTTGAHVGGLMALIGKLFGSKVIYIETFANIHTKTITGKLVYKFADLFIVQWKDMLKLYPNATLGGWIF